MALKPNLIPLTKNFCGGSESAPPTQLTAMNKPTHSDVGTVCTYMFCSSLSLSTCRDQMFHPRYTRHLSVDSEWHTDASGWASYHTTAGVQQLELIWDHPSKRTKFQSRNLSLPASECLQLVCSVHASKSFPSHIFWNLQRFHQKLKPCPSEPFLHKWGGPFSVAVALK